MSVTTNFKYKLNDIKTSKVTYMNSTLPPEQDIGSVAKIII